MDPAVVSGITIVGCVVGILGNRWLVGQLRGVYIPFEIGAIVGGVVALLIVRAFS